MSIPFEMTVGTLDKLRRDGESPLILDVREPQELDICAIDGVLHIPMRQIPERMGELPKDRDIVVVCHHGGRSAQVTMFLRNQGIDRAINLDGGMDAWARHIDPNMKVY